MRHNEQLGKLNRVGVDIVTALPDVAGWQALNLAGLTEVRIERVVSWLPDDTFPLDTISAELHRVFASVHMSERVSSTPIPPGRAWSSNERERVPRSARPHHRWGQSRPTFLTGRTQNQSGASSFSHWDTVEEVTHTQEEDNHGSDTIDPGDLQEYVRDELEILATCMDNGLDDAAIPGVDNPQLETACLKLAELPEALAIVQAAQRGASDQNRLSRGPPGGKGKLDNHLDDKVCPTVRVTSDTVMTNQLRSSEEPNEPGHNLSNAEVRNCKQSWKNEKHAAFVMRVVSSNSGQETLNAQVVLLT